MFDVITIGTTTRDVFLMSPLFKVFKDPEHLKQIGFPSGEAQCFAMGAKIDIDDVVFTTGGGAFNTAVTFARQGLKTAAVSSVGDDDRGSDVITNLKREGVTPLVSVQKDALTTYSTLLLAEGGERTVLVYRNPKENLTTDDLPLRKMKAKWAYVVPGAIDAKTLTSLIDHLDASNTQIAMNPSKHFLKLGLDVIAPILKKLNVVTLNREEAGYLTGVEYDQTEDIFKKMDEMIDGIAVMTDGPKGVIVSDGKKMYQAGIFKEQRLADRTGAGDGFGSGFVSALARGLGIPDAIRLASANATSVVEHIGATKGILTKSAFDTEERWRDFAINENNL